MYDFIFGFRLCHYLRQESKSPNAFQIILSILKEDIIVIFENFIMDL